MRPKLKNSNPLPLIGGFTIRGVIEQAYHLEIGVKEKSALFREWPRALEVLLLVALVITVSPRSHARTVISWK